MKPLVLYILIILFVCKCTAQNFALKTLEGKTIYIQHFQKYKGTVIYFISPECPLCQGYSQTINQIKKQYESKKFRFIAVVSGKYFNTLQVKNFVQEYLFNIPVYMDNDFNLARKLNATVTPQVFVLNQYQQIKYSGRIDNWAYDVGKKRKIITEHDLLNALYAVDKNKQIIKPKTKAVGCFIE